jgi:RNA polymerase sigma-70 factor (ECF subfamily)
LYDSGVLMTSNRLESQSTDATPVQSQTAPSKLDSGWARLDAESLAEMTPELYEELRRLAASYLRGERLEHTLQRTALVHEAYLRLVGHQHPAWQNRAHFLGVFARIMRQTLINHAIAHTRKKRGGTDPIRMALEFYDRLQLDVSALDAALRDLEAVDPRQGQIVELRFFGGLTIAEISSAMGISPATVKREWAIAKLWLHRELSGS